MTIGGKLRLVNGIMLLLPIFFLIVGIAIIYLTFVSKNYGSIANYLNNTESVDYVYNVCNKLFDEYKTQIETTGEESAENIDPYNNKKENIVFTQVIKNSKVIYETSQMQKPENLDKYLKRLGNDNEIQYAIIDDAIIYKGKFENNGSVYEFILSGKAKSLKAIDKNEHFYFSWVKTNVIFLIIVIVIVHFLSNAFYKSIFKRVEYSLKILSDGVDKISEGELNYHIDYDRDDEFRPICEKFNIMTDRLRESMEEIQRQEYMRKEIIMGISHDLFSPLTSIKAYVEGIESGIASTPEAKKKYLGTIKSKANQIEKVVSQLLVYSKLEYEDISPANEKMNLKDYLKEYIQSVDEDYALENVQLSLEKCDDAIIFADKSLLSRMLTNIIENSRKYSDKTVCHILISLEKKERECVLKISDDGPGVAKDSIEHIFEVFYRSDIARNKTSMGSGIGLSIVNNIAVKSLKGRIHAENKNSGGLEIIIEIPTLN